MLAKEIKNGMILDLNGEPAMVESVMVQAPSARGGATLYKFRGRNLVTRQKVDFVLKGTESLDEANFYRRPVKVMYREPDQIHFLDQEDFSQYSLSQADLSHELPYLTDELEGIAALIYNDQCVGIQVPAAVELLVSECDPGVKGNSATSRTKPAKLETGLVVQVPEYLKEGERIKVDTRTGEFLSRV